MRSIRSRVFAYTASSVFRIALTLISLPLVTKYLDPEDYGLFALTIAVSMVFAIMPTSGSSVAMVRGYFGASPEERRTFISSALLVANVVGLLAAGAYLLLWSQISHVLSPSAGAIGFVPLLCVGVSIVSAGWAVFASETLTLDGRATQFMAVSVVRDVVGVTVSLVALYAYGMGASALFLGHGAAAVADIVLGIIILRRYLGGGISLEGIRKIVGEFQFTLVQLVETGGRAIERILISKTLGLDVLGIINHSQSYETIAMAFVKSLVRSVWPENLAEARKPEADYTVAKFATDLISVFCLFAAIFLSTLGYDLVGLLTHNKFNDAAYFAAIWVVAISIRSTGLAPKAVIYSTGRVHLNSISMMIWSSTSLITIFLLIDPLGPSTVAIAALVSAFALKAAVYVGAKRYGQVPFQDVRAILCALLAVSVTVISLLWADTLGTRILLLVMASTAAAIANLDVAIKVVRIGCATFADSRRRAE